MFYWGQESGTLQGGTWKLLYFGISGVVVGTGFLMFALASLSRWKSLRPAEASLPAFGRSVGDNTRRAGVEVTFEFRDGVPRTGHMSPAEVDSAAIRVGPAGKQWFSAYCTGSDDPNCVIDRDSVLSLGLGFLALSICSTVVGVASFWRRRVIAAKSSSGLGGHLDRRAG